LNLNLPQKINILKFILSNKEDGFSINDLVITILMIGLLGTLIIPNLQPALEFVEVLVMEKYLLQSVKECQLGLINNEPFPKYSIPKDDTNVGIFKYNKYIISHTGVVGECAPELGGNILRFSKLNPPDNTIFYSLMINVVNGQKTFDGDIPKWLDWWDGKFSPIIPEEDTYFFN